MTPLVAPTRAKQAECFAAAPQGNVTQTSHKYVAKQKPTFVNVTNTLNFGEAGLV